MHSVKVFHAGINNLLDVETMCKSFFLQTGYSRLVDVDSESLRKTLKHLITDDNGILLVAEKDNEIIGMIGALLYPFYFNHSHKTGQELFWWVNKEHRNSGAGKMLLNAVEEEAKRLGADSFSMISLDAVEPEKADKMYIKAGYARSDHSYIRSLLWQ